MNKGAPACSHRSRKQLGQIVKIQVRSAAELTTMLKMTMMLDCCPRRRAHHPQSTLPTEMDHTPRPQCVDRRVNSTDTLHHVNCTYNIACTPVRSSLVNCTYNIACTHAGPLLTCELFSPPPPTLPLKRLTQWHSSDNRSICQNWSYLANKLSHVTHPSPDLLATANDYFLTTSTALVWCTWHENSLKSASIVGVNMLVSWLSCEREWVNLWPILVICRTRLPRQ